jgi:outer membrane protein assembly factor BamB
LPVDASSTGENKRVGWQLPWDQSHLLAFDIKTGKVRWKAQRGLSRIGHVTPNIFSRGGKETLISGAGDVVQGFDLADGKRLWSVYSQGEGVVPSIVVGKDLIYSASGFEKPTIRAVRPPIGVEEPAIAWEQKKGVPMVPSMLYTGDYLFAITEGGVASCLNPTDGELLWQERVGGNHAASPVWIDGRIYFTSEEGETTVIEAGPEFKILARSPLREKTQASMAVSNQRLYIRTANNLYCIAQK